MIIQIQRQQRADIELENQVFFHVFREHYGIQTVKSLDNDHGIRRQRQNVSLPFSPAGDEVEAGKLHALPRQKTRHVIPEQGHINRIDVLQIQLPVWPRSNSIPVNVIIVKTHENRFLPVNPQLCRQTVGGCSLAGGAGPCQHYHFCAPLTNHICNLGEPLFMQRLVYPNQLPDSAGGCQLI